MSNLFRLATHLRREDCVARSQKDVYAQSTSIILESNQPIVTQSKTTNIFEGFAPPGSNSTLPFCQVLFSDGTPFEYNTFGK